MAGVGRAQFQRNRGRRFGSKTEAMGMAVKTYVCQHCGTHHKAKKPDACSACDKVGFWRFDSGGEAMRFATLCLLHRQGEITDLRLQVPFPIYNQGGGVLSTEKIGKPVMTYYADFVYKDRAGRTVVEDYKGDLKHGQTDVFKLKKRLIEAAYQITIQLVA